MKLKKVKNKTGKGYSVSYAYFLIELHRACNKFTNLRYTTISTKKLRNNFPKLLKLMENDLAWWSPPLEVLTPTEDNSLLAEFLTLTANSMPTAMLTD